jgi:hypothetical protein
MGCKPNQFLYNTGIRRSSKVLFLTVKLRILKGVSLIDRILHQMENPDFTKLPARLLEVPFAVFFFFLFLVLNCIMDLTAM